MGIFDLKVLNEELDAAELDEDGVKWVYLGSVMNLYPSGKFYTPWACGNVQICKACAEAGLLPCDDDTPCTDGEHCEACQDAQWVEAAEAELETINACLASGEGDPTDLFATRSI